MRLALGTAQFGGAYGVANVTGQVDVTTAAAILDKARLAGIDTLDTAIGYGESERCLGEIGIEGWQIVSKLPELPSDNVNTVDWVYAQAAGSLKRLGVTRLTGLLLHRPGQLLGHYGDALWSAMTKLKFDGVVEKIGYSIYEPGELDALVGAHPPDLIQAPYNILDRRLAMSGWLERLTQLGIEVHARSLFLQGLLLLQSRARPSKFSRWSQLWDGWDRWLHEVGLTPLQACLAFGRSETRISRLVVGVDSLRQFDEILGSADTRLGSVPDSLNIIDVDLINPSRWSSL